MKRTIEKLLKEIPNLLETKLELLDNCFRGILSVDDEKIEKINTDYYSNNAWLEETCSPSYPDIKIIRSGIGNSILYNNKETLDETIEW